MSSMHRAAAAVLAVCCLIGLTLPLAEAAPAPTFRDVPATSYAAAAIADLTARGIIHGVGGGLFLPDAALTRAQTAALLARAEGWPLDGIGPAFDDVPADAWFHDPVEAAASQGAINGVGDQEFAPGGKETRAEAATSLVRALGLRHVADDEAHAALRFADADQTPAWARGPLAVAVHLGLIRGIGSYLDPNGVLTRAQAAVLIERVLHLSTAALQREGDRVAAYVHVVPARGEVNAGATLALHAYAHDATGYIVPASFTWSASGSGRVVAGGTFTAGAAGIAHVTARVPGGPGATATLEVRAPTALAWQPASTVVAAGSTLTFGVQVMDAAGHRDRADTGRTVTLRDAGQTWTADTKDGVVGFKVRLAAGPHDLHVSAPGLTSPAPLALTATTARYQAVLSAPSANLASGASEPLVASVVDGAGRAVPGTFAIQVTVAGGAEVRGAPPTVTGAQSSIGRITFTDAGAVEVSATVAGGAVGPGQLSLQGLPHGAIEAQRPTTATAGETTTLTFTGPVPNGTRLAVIVTDPAGHNPPGYGATFAGGVATVRVAPTIAGTWRYTGDVAGYTAAKAIMRVTPGPAVALTVHPLPTSILLPGQQSQVYVGAADAYGNPVAAAVHARLTLTGAGSLATASGVPSGPSGSASDGSLAADLPGPGVAALYTAPAAPGTAHLTVVATGLPSAHVVYRTVADPAGIVAGKGLWLTFPDWKGHSDADLIRTATADGVTHLYLEVATTDDGFYGGRGLDDFLWKAHDAGIAVVSWVYPALWQPAADIATTQAVAAYTTPLGDTADGLAADIEENMDPATVARYAAAARAAVGKGLLVGITYPPQQMPQYPFAALAPYVDAWAPMDYWHQEERDYTYHEVYKWIRQSMDTIRSTSGRPQLPFDVILQTFDAFAGSEKGIFSPTPAELAGATAAAAADGAAGISYYHWSSATPAEWSVIADSP